jgi:hypothetical protein
MILNCVSATAIWQSRLHSDGRNRSRSEVAERPVPSCPTGNSGLIAASRTVNLAFPNPNIPTQSDTERPIESELFP